MRTFLWVFETLNFFLYWLWRLSIAEVLCRRGLSVWEHWQSSCSGKMRGTWMLLGFNFWTAAWVGQAESILAPWILLIISYTESSRCFEFQMKVPKLRARKVKIYSVFCREMGIGLKLTLFLLFYYFCIFHIPHYIIGFFPISYKNEELWSLDREEHWPVQ